MIALTEFKNKNIALLGLGKSGLASAKALVKGGANLFAFDDNESCCETALNEGIDITDLKTINWAEIDYLVISPGIPLTHPKPHWCVSLANQHGVEIIGDIGLFFAQKNHQAPNAVTICITGTNGKSTTTALITHMLNEAGKKAVALGNIGYPILAHAALDEEEIYVIECSSYQIDLAPDMNPDHSVFLNLSPDHIDRHGSLENYAQVKKSLIASTLKQGGKGYISIDDSQSLHVYQELHELYSDHAFSFSTFDQEADFHIFSNQLYDGDQNMLLKNIDEFPALKGKHNHQNLLAAFAVGCGLRLSLSQIHKAFMSFGGLAHRMQKIADFKNISFVNDSKATNADATEKSLQCFQNIYWILGGQSKEGGINALLPYFERIKHAFLIGEATNEFANRLAGKVEYTKCETLQNAVQHAAQMALKQDNNITILLAPAAASWDQFKSFEHRGEVFMQLVDKFIKQQNS